MAVIAKLNRVFSCWKSLSLTTGLTASLVVGCANLSRADVVYTGVSAGDATSNSVILWTRATDTVTPTQPTNLTLQIATDLGFSNIVKTVNGVTDASKDFTYKSEVTGLSSGTQYYYRFVSGAFQSGVGKFKTAPVRNQSVPVRFGFSGDVDGRWRPYPSTQNFGSLGLDFFVFLGDTIYEASSTGSSAAILTDASPLPLTTLLNDFHRKYREQFSPVNTNGFSGLKTLFASQGNYTLLDNHELGNKQYINGGAPIGTLPGPGADASTTGTANDVNTTGVFINKTDGFKTLLQAYKNYQPIRERTISAPSEPRTDGTQVLYFAQQWGANLVFINLDDRSYRDIRMKTAGNAADDTGIRAANTQRTMLGKTQLAWLKRTLLIARDSNITWKFIAVSSPIDEIGPTSSLASLGTGDGGKSWIGGYRAERNELLKFIADNNIKNVVFLSTDDHLNRVNELTYLNDINNVSSSGGRTVVPGAFTIVAGPLGADGPQKITDHSFSNIQTLANTLAAAQSSIGVNPLGLAANFTGLQNIYREFDATANNSPQPVDFFTPDTFNYVTFDISADGKLLTVSTWGINSYAENTFAEPSGSNPVRKILSFDINLQPAVP